MAKKKVTSKKVAKKTSTVLKSKSTGKSSKSAAGSALSQTKAPKKTTSKKAASSASKVLKDGRTSKASKSAAGSALSQKKSTKKKKQMKLDGIIPLYKKLKSSDKTYGVFKFTKNKVDFDIFLILELARTKQVFQ